MKSEKFPASLLIDGNLMNYAHTYAATDGMWVRLHLSSAQQITRVVVYNRHHGCCQGRIVGASVEVVMGQLLIHTCGKLDTAQAQYDISCERQYGDVVQISQSGEVGQWNLAEIRVFGLFG